MNIFKKITVGDTATWADAAWKDPTAFNEQLTSAIWTLTYQLRGSTQLTITAVPDAIDSGWVTSLSSTDSATLSAGPYIWAAYLSSDLGRRTVGGGTLYIAADLSTISTALDARSVAEKALSDCETALASFNSTGGKVKRYSIGSRQTEFHTLAELMSLRDFWQIKVNNERAKDAIKNGRVNPRTLRVGFI